MVGVGVSSLDNSIILALLTIGVGDNHPDIIIYSSWQRYLALRGFFTQLLVIGSKETTLPYDIFLMVSAVVDAEKPEL